VDNRRNLPNRHIRGVSNRSINRVAAELDKSFGGAPISGAASPKALAASATTKADIHSSNDV
jgi:hypothetical protein